METEQVWAERVALKFADLWDVPVAAPWFIYIERQYGPDVQIGPYATEDDASTAMEESMLIDSLCTEDCLDCYLTTDLADDDPNVERILP